MFLKKFVSLDGFFGTGLTLNGCLFKCFYRKKVFFSLVYLVCMSLYVLYFSLHVCLLRVQLFDDKSWMLHVFVLRLQLFDKKNWILKKLMEGFLLLKRVVGLDEIFTGSTLK